DAVAMTGGQPVEQQISPIDMVNQLLSEGVRPVYLVSDDPSKYVRSEIPHNAELHHRDELDQLQRQLREMKGVTGIVYEQTCATEKRRRRKRGLMVAPDKRMYINPDVCEGCSDCSVQSNCISITPLETEFGRKRKIDQSTCNKDYSCVKGFCPSFVTVEGAQIAVRSSGDPARLNQLIANLPEPSLAPLGEHGYNILVGGIGGTGVLTIGALLGMAAHVDGKGATILDMTGMAQKGGAVTSHIRIGKNPESIYTSRLSEGMCDLLIACDLIVGSGQTVLKTVRPKHTAAILNTDVAPTGEFQTNKYLDLGEARLRAAILDALDGGPAFDLHASKLATDLTGDSIGTNVLMMGYAAQKGLLPVSVAAIEEAIRLNGTFVKGNLRTFALGRLAAHDLPALLRELDESDKVEPVKLDTVDDVLASRMRLLTKFQDARYAETYRVFVDDVRKRVAALSVVKNGIADGDKFVREVALSLGKLMYYKDEYEVARLYTDPKFMERLREQFAGDFKISFNLASDMLLPARDADGHPKKRNLGPWILTVFKLLAPLKVLRGTPFDPIGYLPERKLERRLIGEYRDLINRITDKLDPANFATGVDIASAAADIGGYGHVKAASIERYQTRLKSLLDAFDNPKGANDAPRELRVQQI
ncbi:MAG TPA: DUF6537 domain-containing protein, partial [Spongiibacteraceae bacterium]|nr:DUF6537 domain-containing protein [Spongiibacteraceae bacterium]